jgi:hypothetical protein
VVDVSDPTNPHQVGYCYAPDWACGVYISGSLAYVAATRSQRLQVVDVSDPTNPYQVGACYTSGWAEDVYVSGSLAYVAAYKEGLRVVDVSDPTNPQEVGYCDTPDWTCGVHVSGSLAYVADGSGFRVVDVSDPANPHLVGYWDDPGYAYDVHVSGSLAYVADWDGGLVILEFLGDTAVEEIYEPASPIRFSLSQNVPNPFNTRTLIGYGLPVSTDVSIQIYNLSGQLVRVLVQGSIEAGHHTVAWDGMDERGEIVAAGIYLYRAAAGRDHLTGKMLLLR